jgi:DMSO/TMAO reductase YedYZ heme-binding membrane subunit
MLYYAGVFALIALCASVGLGLVATDRIILNPGHRVFVQSAHRAVSFGAVAFLIVHITTEILAQRSHLLDAVVPFLSPFRTFYIGLGTIASDLIILLVITGIMRGRFTSHGKAWRWRAIHYTSYLAFVFGVWHGLLGGRPGKGYVDWSYGFVVAFVAMGVAVRIMANSLRPKETLSAPPVDMSAASASAPMRAAAMFAVARNLRGGGRLGMGMGTGAQTMLSAPVVSDNQTRVIAALPSGPGVGVPGDGRQPVFEPGYEGPPRYMGAPRRDVTGPQPRAATGPMPRAATGPMPRAATGPMPRAATGPMPRAATGPMPRVAPGPMPGGPSGPMPAVGPGPQPRGATGPMPRAATGPMPRVAPGPMPGAPSGPMPAVGPGPQPRGATGPMPRAATGPMPRAATGPMPMVPSGPMPMAPGGPMPRAATPPMPGAPSGPMPGPATGPMPPAPGRRSGRAPRGASGPMPRANSGEQPRVPNGQRSRPATGPMQRPATGPMPRAATGPMPMAPSGPPPQAGGPGQSPYGHATMPDATRTGGWSYDQPPWAGGAQPVWEYREPGPGMPGYRPTPEEEWAAQPQEQAWAEPQDQYRGQQEPYWGQPAAEFWGQPLEQHWGDDRR